MTVVRIWRSKHQSGMASSSDSFFAVEVRETPKSASMANMRLRRNFLGHKIVNTAFLVQTYVAVRHDPVVVGVGAAENGK